jgi:L-threonylcarbamoyladenylate synthase
MKTDLLPTHTAALFAEAVRRSVEVLQAGEMVALPTETVYGLAANALDAEAVARVFEVKARPAHNPVIVHVASIEMAQRCAALWPAVADKLAAAFWPGPLTLVLPRAAEIPDIVTAGGSTVGIRWASHPFLQAVIRACGFPLAAPSANPANQLSPTSAEHVRKGLEGKIPLIIDGGQCQVGIESTVLDLVHSPFRILRPGMIPVERFRAILAGTEVQGSIQAVREETNETSPARSPGQLPKHYAPKARLLVLGWTDTADLRRQLASLQVSTSATRIIAHTHIPDSGGFSEVSVIPCDAEAFARGIYAELHNADAAGAETIVVEALPDEEAWQGLADRLRRAAR